MYAQNTRRNNLGFLETLIPLAAAALSKGSSGSGGSSGGAAIPPPSGAQTQVQTQVSPQISPIFQQQFQPSNSAQSAGTAQSLPAMPTLTNNAGYPDASGVPTQGGYPPGYSLPAPLVPSVPSASFDYSKILPYAFGAVALAVGYKIFAARKK